MQKRQAYQTQQKRRILDCLAELHGAHVTVEQLSQTLRGRGVAVGQTTIYRALEKLVQEGQALRFTTPDGMAACYQYVGAAHSCEMHHHLVCTDCGKMQHVACTYLDDLTTHVHSEHGFTLDHQRTVLYGRCTDCTRSNAAGT